MNVVLKCQSLQETNSGWNMVWKKTPWWKFNLTPLKKKEKELEFHWNSLKMNIPTASNSVKKHIFLTFYWKFYKEIHWCRDKMMVFSYRGSVLYRNYIDGTVCFRHACFMTFSILPDYYKKKVITLKIFTTAFFTEVFGSYENVIIFLWTVRVKIWRINIHAPE